LDDGQAKEVLRGDEAGAMVGSASAWQAVGPLVPRSTDGKGQVVELVSSGSKKLVMMLYVVPPFQLEARTLRISSITKRAAAFTQDNKFLFYELFI
jgi:hypothetical protein